MKVLNREETEKVIKDIALIKESLLGDPYDSNNSGLVHKVGENTKAIEKIKKNRWKSSLTYFGIGGLSGAGSLSAKGSAFIAKIISIFGM